MSERPPSSFDRYRVGHRLGAGGFSTVYLGHLDGREGFTKRVALKFLHADLTRRAGLVRRFRDEARILGLLEHPNIIGVHGLIEFQGTWAVVMEYLRGVDLETVATELGRVPASAALQIADRTLSALRYAQNLRPNPGAPPMRLEHRDIKPSNILVDGHGAVKVLDFGIARAQFNAREAATKASGMMGTLAFMPTERWLGKPALHGDVYALAGTLLQVIVGGPTLQAESFDEFEAWRQDLAKVVEKRLDADLAGLLVRATSREPSQRLSIEEFQRGIRAIQLPNNSQRLEPWAESVLEPYILMREQDQSDGPMSGQILVPSTLPPVGGTGARTPAAATVDLTLPPPSRGPLVVLASVAALALLGAGGMVYALSQGETAPETRALVAPAPVEIQAEPEPEVEPPPPAPVEEPKAQPTPQEAPPAKKKTPRRPPSEPKRKVRVVKKEVPPPPPPVEEPPKPQLTDVRLGGDARQVALHGDRGVFSGSTGATLNVPPGRYKVYASFSEADPADMNTWLEVSADGTHLVRCQTAFGRCSAR